MHSIVSELPYPHASLKQAGREEFGACVQCVPSLAWQPMFRPGWAGHSQGSFFSVFAWLPWHVYFFIWTLVLNSFSKYFTFFVAMVSGIFFSHYNIFQLVIFLCIWKLLGCFFVGFFFHVNLAEFFFIVWVCFVIGSQNQCLQAPKSGVFQSSYDATCRESYCFLFNSYVSEYFPGLGHGLLVVETVSIFSLFLIQWECLWLVPPSK